MDESAQFPRPTAKDVVIRMVAIDMMRARFDQEAFVRENQPNGASDIRQAYVLVQKAADNMQPQKLFSPNEWQTFYSPLGSWSDKTMAEIEWRHESTGVLGWAIRKISDIADYDKPFDVPTAGKLKDLLGTEPPVLRHEDEITLARDNAQMWNWRARTTIIIAQGEKPPPGLTFPQIIATVANGSHEKGWLPTPIGNDFPAFGKAYRDLTEQECYYAYSVALERHYALNWLCGYGRDWDSVPTGT